MEGVGVDGGCKNFAAENQRCFSFLYNINNDHVINLLDFDLVRKIGYDNCRTRIKEIEQIDRG